MKPKLRTNQTSSNAFQYAYMALDKTDGYGLSNEAYHYLLLKNAVFAICYAVTNSTLLTIRGTSV